VLPIDCTTSPYRPPQGRFLSLWTAITSLNIAALIAGDGSCCEVGILLGFWREAQAYRGLVNVASAVLIARPAFVAVSL
jgi:hypothetical protein